MGCYHDHKQSAIENTYRRLVRYMKANHLKPCSDLYVLSLVNLYDSAGSDHTYFKLMFFCYE